MSLKDIQNEHARLSILRLLAEQAGYSANASILQDALNALGLKVSRDQVKGQLAWLSDQDMVTLEELGQGVVVVELSSRGMDVATGNITHPGIRRPRPTD